MQFEGYEISSAQRQIWLAEKLNDGSGNRTLYNIPSAKIIHGPLQAEQLENAVRLLIQRQETLRTCFAETDDEIIQKVYEDMDFKLDFRSTLNRVISESELSDISDRFVRPFDLTRLPLWRMELIALEENKHLLLFDIHHIIADGTSITLIFDQLMTLCGGGNLPPLDAQYVDFTIWQNDLVSSEEIVSMETFWVELFSDDIPVLRLPLDFPRPSKQDNDGQTVIYPCSKQKVPVETLNRLAAKEGTTLYVLMLAVYYIMLSRYTLQDDIVVGVPVDLRAHDELKPIVGMFVNTLPLRHQPLAEQPFNRFLSGLTENTFKAFDNRDYPFELLVERMNPPRQVNRNRVFEVTFDFHRSVSSHLTDHETGSTKPDVLYASTRRMKQRTSKYDLSLAVRETGESITLELLYRCSLFRKDTIQRMAVHLENITAAIADEPGIRLKDIEMLSDREKQTLLKEFNRTAMDYPRTKTVTQLFADRVRVSRDSVALKGFLPASETKNGLLVSMTFGELDHRSSLLAERLKTSGIVPGKVAALLAHRTVNHIVSILAVLKAGGIYLPVDPGFPTQRLRFIIGDSRASVILNETGDVEETGETGDRRIGGWEGPERRW